MGTLYLVRHGQASFGADNYDQLSALGWRQSRRLGEHFLQQGRQFDVILTGTPAGVGNGRGEYLNKGDVVIIEIERLGKIRNRFV